MTARAQLADGDHVTVEGPAPLDRQLRSLCRDAATGEELSWATVRKAIRTGKVKVDGALVREPAQGVRRGATISVSMTAPRDGGVKLPEDAIVYLDPQLVVVDKPSGMAAVPDEARHQGTLLTILTERLHRRGRRVPLGVVSRLDIETSGLIVFTRTPEAYEHLKAQFAERRVEKTYLAIVAGEAKDTTYTSRLVEYADGKRKSTQNRNIGKWSRTHVEVVERLAGATLVRCTLETGRTHQIRIHLSEAGHPLLGDARYARRRVPTPPAPRVMLHADMLAFEHPSGERLSFERHLPPDMVEVLRSLALEPPRR